MKKFIHYKHVAMSGFSFPMAARIAFGTTVAALLPGSDAESSFSSCAIENANRYARTDMVCSDISQISGNTATLTSQFTQFVESYTDSSSVVNATLTHLSDQLSTLSQTVASSQEGVTGSLDQLSKGLTTTTDSARALGNAVVSMVDAFLSLADGSFGSGPLRDTLNDLSTSLHDQGYTSGMSRKLTDYVDQDAFHSVSNPLPIALSIGIPLVILGVLTAAEGKVSGERTAAASLLGVGLYLAVTSADTILGNIVQDISAVALVLTGVALTLHNAYTTATDPTRQKAHINSIAKQVNHIIAELPSDYLKQSYSSYIESGEIRPLANALYYDDLVKLGDRLTECSDKIIDSTAPRAPHVERAARKIVAGLLIETTDKHPDKGVDERLTVVENAITAATGWKSSWSGFHLETALDMIKPSEMDLVDIQPNQHIPEHTSIQLSIEALATREETKLDGHSNPSISTLSGSDLDIDV